MHEMSLAISLVDLVCEQVTAAGAARASQVEVAVGPLAGVVPESLRFCFDAAARGTKAEGASLDILEEVARAVCTGCGHEEEILIPTASCPLCGGILVATGGRSMRLVAVTVEDANDV